MPTTETTASVDAVDRALVPLSAIVFVLSVAQQHWVQAVAVGLLFVVAVTKLRDPHATWINWMPLSDR